MKRTAKKRIQMRDKIQHNHPPLSSDLDVNLSSTGKVVKAVGEAFSLKTNIDASDVSKVSWTKVTALVVIYRRGETRLMEK